MSAGCEWPGCTGKASGTTGEPWRFTCLEHCGQLAPGHPERVRIEVIARAEGAAAERARIVAWLLEDLEWLSWEDAARAIEAGEHEAKP